MDFKRINWLGLAGGIVTIVLVVLSLVYAFPWWQITVSEDVGQANISPMSFNAKILGDSIVIPLIFFLNLTVSLSLLASAIAMIIYSIFPLKNYSKHLLGFAYKKPLFTLIMFIVLLVVSTYAAGRMLNVNFPLIGASTLTLDVGDATMEVPISTGFTWVFWLAVAAAALCIAARLYHRKILYKPPSPPSPPSPPPPQPA